MARIRTIKPDAFTSDSLSSVPRGTRWTFAGLWTYADDKGRARDDVRLIKAALYPLDDEVTLTDVANDLDMLARIGGICRYEVAGRGYLHMPNWGHQKINRPTPAKSPPCPEHEDGMSGHVLPVDDSLSNHGALSEPSTWEWKGREGKGRDSCSPADADGATEIDGFEDWWDVYGKKVGRKKAEQKYRLALRKPGVDAGLLIKAAGSYVAGQRAKGKHPEFTKDPATWLNGEHWTDEDPAPEPSQVHRLPYAHELERPPDGLSDEEYDAWDREQRRKQAGR